MIAKGDGTVEVWDLLDQCHKPSLTFSSGHCMVTSMQFWQTKLQSSQQYLAVGDSEGKLHVIEIPRNLRRSANNEDQQMRAFYDREIKRVEYCLQRKDIRANEKRDEEPEDSKDNSDTLQLTSKKPTPEEIELERQYQEQLKKWKEQLLND